MSNYVSAYGTVMFSQKGMDDYENIRKELWRYSISLDQDSDIANKFEVFREGATSSYPEEMYGAFNGLGDAIASGHIDFKSEYGADWCIEKSYGDENFYSGKNLRLNGEIIDVRWNDEQDHSYEEGPEIAYAEKYDFGYREQLRWEYDAATHYSPYVKPTMPIESIRIQMAERGILPDEDRIRGSWIRREESEWAEKGAVRYCDRTEKIEQADPCRTLRAEFTHLQDKAFDAWERYCFDGSEFKAEEWLLGDDKTKYSVIGNLFEGKYEAAFEELKNAGAFGYKHTEDFRSLENFCKNGFEGNMYEYVISDVFREMEKPESLKNSRMKDFVEAAVLYTEEDVISKEKQYGIIPDRYIEMAEERKNEPERDKQKAEPERENEYEMQMEEGTL